MSKLTSFLLAKPSPAGQYAFVVVRLVIAAFWLNATIPRWVALVAGHPQANGLVRNLFGASVALPLTYVFTSLENSWSASASIGVSNEADINLGNHRVRDNWDYWNNGR